MYFYGLVSVQKDALGFEFRPVKERKIITWKTTISFFDFGFEPCSYASLPKNDYRTTVHQNTNPVQEEKKTSDVFTTSCWMQMYPKCLDRLWATMS